MGILKSLFTLGKSFVAQAEEAIDEAQGVRMLEQHIRDAKAELDKAGKSRVDLLARVKLSHDKLNDLRERKASLETRALAAMSKNVDAALLNEVAEEIARLENAILAEEQVLTNLEASRDAVEKAVTATGQRIAQFEQQLEVVKATEAMQRAQQAVTTSTVGAASNVSTAAESLKRLQTRQAERQARLDAAAQLEKVADGRDLDENWRRPVLAQPIKAMLRMCWRVYSVNKANNALYVDCQNLPASFVQTDLARFAGPVYRAVSALLSGAAPVARKRVGEPVKRFYLLLLGGGFHIRFWRS